MMQLSFQFEPMTPPKDMAARLRMAANVLEGVAPKEAAKVENTEAAPKKKGRPAKTEIEAAPEVNDEDQMDFDLDAEGDDEPEAPTLEMVSEAFKNYVKRHDKDAAFAILKKLKVKSVREIPESQYQKVLDLIK